MYAGRVISVWQLSNHWDYAILCRMGRNDMELYRGSRLSVEKIRVRMPDGQERDRVVVHPGDAVAVLPFTTDSGCYLIRQFRFAIGQYILEAPAGTLNPGESPDETAYRELIEET